MVNQNILQKEYLELIEEEIQSGNIKLEDDDQYFDMLGNRFPVGGTGIAWSKVPNHQYFNLLELKDDTDNYGKMLHESFQKIVSFLDQNEDQEVVIIGDGVLDVAIRVPFRKLIDLHYEVFTLPQHTYILPPDASWCINFTFEHDLFFGIAPSQLT